MAQTLDNLSICHRRLAGRDNLRDFIICCIDLTKIELLKTQHRRQLVIIGVENQGLCPLRQHQFLTHLLLHALEICLMGVTDGGDNCNIGANHTLQTSHLVWLGDTRLDECHILVALNHQKRQGHAQLRVITHRRGEELHILRQGAGCPFLHYGLAVGARDTHHNTLKACAMLRRQALQSLDGVIHHDVTRTLQCAHLSVALDHKGTHTALIHIGKEVMRIVIHALHSDKHSTIAEGAVA